MEGPKATSWNKIFEAAEARLPFQEDQVLAQSNLMIEGLLSVLKQEGIDIGYVLREEQQKLHPDNTPPANLFMARRDVWNGKIRLGESTLLKGYDEKALIYAFAERRYYRFIEFLKLNNSGTLANFEAFESNKQALTLFGWKGQTEQLDLLYSELKDYGFIDCQPIIFKGLFIGPFIGKVKWLKVFSELGIFIEILSNASLLERRITHKELCHFFLNSHGKPFGEKSVTKSRSSKFGKTQDFDKLIQIINKLQISKSS